MVDERSTVLRALKGCPLSIVMALLLYRTDNRALGPTHLAAITGYTRKTVSAALAVLAEMGLAQRHARYTGWTLAEHTRQLFLPTDAPQLTDSTQLTADPEHLNLEGENSLLPPAEGKNLPIDGENSPLPPKLVSSVHSPDSEDTTDLLTPGAATTNPKLAQILLDAGVYHPLALRIASDPWCTPRCAQAWIQDIRRQMEQPAHGIRSLPALLATNLQNHHVPPPEPAPADDSWRRFLCPRCSAFPCECATHV